MGGPMIQWRDYGFTYAGAESPVLTDLSLSVERGDFLLVCGKSGSGKTTLLRNMKPELAPAGTRRGGLLIEGRQALSPLESARKIGFVMQEPENQLVMDSVWMELAFGMENLAVPPEEIGRRIGEIAGFFGIQSWFGRSVFELSGGQKQILNLAAVIAMQAEIIVLDEPVARLDPIAAKEFLQMLARVNGELGKTILLSEHRIDDVLSVCDKVLYLEEGRAAFFGDHRAFPVFLRDRGGQDVDFTRALPAPTRVAMACGTGERLPLDVKEGRAWLEAAMTTRSFYRNPAITEPLLDPHIKSLAPALRAKQIWFRYGKDQDYVLKGLELEVAVGRIRAVIGGNGCGKSTLLSLLSGVHTPQRGKIEVFGGRRRVLLPQEPMSVFVCDRLLDDLKEHDTGIRDEDVSAMAEKLGLSHLLQRHPYDLSGGEMQKAALAKVLLLKPDILMLDEPVKGLDAFARRDLGEILRGLAGQDMTIILVTHDLEFAAEYADDCSMIFSAAVIADGRGREFFNNNMFYTTSVNRMTRDLIAGCVLAEDVSWEDC